MAELRARTGALLAAAALTATFLGGQALEDPGFGVTTITALAVLGSTLGCCLWVLLPRELVFEVDARSLHEESREDRDEVGVFLLRCAFRLADARQGNQLMLDRLSRVFAFGVVALVAQVLAWALDLVLA